LLAKCELELKKLDCSSIILETLNPDAVRLYTKQGFSKISCIKEYVKGFDLVHMLKKI